MQSDPLDFEHLVEPLFQEALDVPPGRRAAFLEHRCGDDRRLRARIERLLQASSEADHERFWQGSALHAEASGIAEELDASVPDRYRLVERIGAGGMGAVYKAFRADDEYTKLVAVKIVQASDPHMVERFRKEREILARLEHPGIARLLDGGSTRDKRPFLAMEYVEGVPVDRYVAAKKLPLRETLTLFRKICAAVSYAHINLVVHRDLKPANILVTEAGEPKLLDFGIAKLLDEGNATRTGVAAMTPDYASPEQVTGAPITTSSDIYSLGILLYEVLTGHRPYAAATPLELTKAIVSESPQPLGPAFDRDLETIVQMALRKEPERRYASVDQFSEDVQRYLDGYPVKARPDTAAYRAAKFIARNRAVVAGIAILFLILIAGIAATEWEAHTANERFADVRELAHSVVFDYHDAIENLPGSTPVRERMVKDALRYLNKLSQSGGGDDLQREVAESYIKISRVQGNDYSSNLGDVKGAGETADKAVAIAGKLVARQASTQNVRLLAEAYKEQADVRYSAGDLEGASVAYRKSVAQFERVLPQIPAGDLEVREIAVNAYCHLGELLGGEGTTNLGRPEEAMEPYRKALPIAGLMAAQHPDSHIAQKAMYTVQLGIALLNYAAGHLNDAENANRGAVATMMRIAQANPNSMTDQMELTVARARLARVLSDNGKAAEAAAMELSSIAVIDAQAKLDPLNVVVLRGQSLTEWQEANALLVSGDAKNALGHAERAVALARSLRKRNPNDAVVIADLARRLALFAEVDTALGRPDSALLQGREAMRVLGESPFAEQNADLRRVTAIVRLAIGQAALKVGDPASALAEFEAAESFAAHELAAHAGRFPDRLDLGQAEAGKADCESRLGRVKQAAIDYRASLAVWEALRAAEMLPPRFAGMPQHIAETLRKLPET